MKNRVVVWILAFSTTVSIATVAPTTSVGAAGSDISELLLNGRHLFSINSPQNGGAPMGCPPGVACAK